MQQLTAETTQFLADLQSHAGRQLNFPHEVGQILELARGHRLDQVFLDAIFHAKFAVKSKEVMGRIGADGEGFDKLATEFRNSVEKTSALLRTIVKESPDEIKQHFVRDFFGMDQESFANLLKLMEDLAWVKNWEVDGKPIPLHDAGANGKTEARGAGGPYGRIRLSAALGLTLMALLCVADPPVSVLGWTAAFLVCVLFLVIALASHKAMSN